MRIGITGASGFVGGAVVKESLLQGHTVIAFSRSPCTKISGCKEVRILQANKTPDLSGLDAVVNLAGESILGYWTRNKKRRIRESRVSLTRSIVDAMEGSPVRILINASAIGMYGETGVGVADETTEPSDGFLGEVARQWEGEALRAERAGARVILLRMGMVLGREGGAMKVMKPQFKWGLGGCLGSGQQSMSCIHVEDVARLILFSIEQAALSGPINAVLPRSVTNREFTRILAETLHRPAFLHVPAFLLRSLAGEFSEVVLTSQNVMPSKAIEAGFVWRYPDVRRAIAAVL